MLPAILFFICAIINLACVVMMVRPRGSDTPAADVFRLLWLFPMAFTWLIGLLVWLFFRH